MASAVKKKEENSSIEV